MLARVTALLVLVLLSVPARAVPEETRVAVIVHPARGGEIRADDVAQIYLRRKRFWDDGSPIVPLNIAADAPLRNAFSRAVFHREADRLVEYWNRQYFYGIRPPATLASSAAMKRYVSSDPNAIGYVAASDVDDSVRVVLLLD
jgi:hypothetical protein